MFADLPGVQLCFTDTGGNGVPVILLHANTGSSRNWANQIPAFTAAGFRVIAYDRRGGAARPPSQELSRVRQQMIFTI